MQTKVAWALVKRRVANKLKRGLPRSQTSQDSKRGPATPTRATPPECHAPSPTQAPLLSRPHRGTRQDKDGFLSRQRYVRVCLHQGLYSRQRQPREASPSGCTRRSLGLRSCCLPSGSVLLSGRPAPSSRRCRHPRPKRAARDSRLSARTRFRPFPAPVRDHASPCGRGSTLPRRGAPETPPLALVSVVAFRAATAWKRPGVA